MRARAVLAAAGLAAGAALLWTVRRSLSAPPEIAFAQAKRETLVSSLASNGKAEPALFAPVRARREGVVQRVALPSGSRVRSGEVLVELDPSEARIELAAAEARLRQARAALEILAAGGRAAELAEIDSALARTRLELEAAEREHGALRRLLAKQAATGAEVEAAEARLRRARADLQGLENKRAALVSPPDRSAAEARLKEAEAALRQAAQRLDECLLRSPLEGIVYELRVRPGDYLRPGDPAASVGKLDPIRVRLYVDEPELGRLAPGMPVRITWDALPGRDWQGRIERMPVEVFALGTRQVGEVLLTIENPGLDLLPGANVNAEIRTQTVNDGLIIPKEAVRREGERAGVYVLGEGDRLSWRAVKLGASTLTRAQVLEGLREGDRVALGSDRPLRDGLRVRPRLP